MGSRDDDWTAQEAAFFGTDDGGGDRKPKSSSDGKNEAAGGPSRRRSRSAGGATRVARLPAADPPSTVSHFLSGRSDRARRSPGGGGRRDRSPRSTTPTRAANVPPLASTANSSAPASSLLPDSLASIARRIGDSVGIQVGSAAAHLSSQIASHLDELSRSCVVCGAPSPSRYRYHPFFPEERACASHSEEELGACCYSCRRFSPLPGHTPRSPFADLDDHGRKICEACLRTVVVDSEQGAQLWYGALRYFHRELGLFDLTAQGGGGKGVKERMEAIPVVVVDMDALNDPSVRGSGHGRGNGGAAAGGGGAGGAQHTRGLCLYEYKYDPLGGQLRDFLRGTSCDSTAATVLDALGGGVASAVAAAVANPTTDSHVTAVLCLRGLPRDLAASVLSHEATHAWFKLHPEYDATDGLPKVVEEGCCQLVAFLYLSYLDAAHREDSVAEAGYNGEPSNHKLRQYFRFCIETMKDDVYGEGFRKAAAAHALLGSVRAVLEYVMENRSFPSTS